MNSIDKNNFVYRFCFALLALCCHGCLLGGNGKEEKVVYPVATMTTPQRELEKEAEEPPAKRYRERNSLLTAFRQEVNKELSDLSKETREAQEDLLTRTTALEADYQQLMEKVSLLEFLQGEASSKMAKMQESLEFELETLRQQIEDYNGLLVKILDKISTSPDTTQLEEPVP